MDAFLAASGMGNALLHVSVAGLAQAHRIELHDFHYHKEFDATIFTLINPSIFSL